MRTRADGSRLRHNFFGCVLLLILTGCSLDGTTTREWTEDVLLDDGSTIVVKRSVTIRGTNSIGGDAANTVERDAALTFTGNLARLPPWRAPLRALLLYQDKEAGEWVLVATTTSCETWNSMGAPQVMYLPDRPSTMYWEFRLGSGGWREVPLSPSSVGRPGNLLRRYHEDLHTDHVTVAFRRVRDSDPRVSRRFVEIQERPQVNCNLDALGIELRAARDKSDTTKTTAGD